MPPPRARLAAKAASVSEAGTVAVNYESRDESNEANTEDVRGWSPYDLHKLSKRTTLYTTYSPINTKGNALTTAEPHAGGRRRSERRHGRRTSPLLNTSASAREMRP